MTHLLERLLNVPDWVVLTVVFLLPAAEAAILLGMFIPGEIALILGGVAASVGHVSVLWVLVCGVLGAIIGDSIGYFVGERWGIQLLHSTLGRKVPIEKLDAARAFIARRGGRAVFIGRFTAALRALVPGLAGMSGVPYRVFLPWNIAGGAVWACGSVGLGYAAGTSWELAAHYASIFGATVLGLVAVAVALTWWRHKRSLG
ncbi:putative membrane protein [Nocardioides baekrokdamisoli]|uniref:Putative membrane protein n=1 Tax=Nocardioides baekrokdamisoli TaxID=1804624 RepID=A0A3G9IF49_9ACTN|nr:DedA family protein [Nocardioides baekrokdamisoli]BBH17577.1 putative membrane protein [Nocardioides baekrokdamisoli]